MRGPSSAKSAWERWLLWGPLEACAMAAVGWSLATVGVLLMAAVPGDPGAWWRALPGWILWAWAGKRSAGAGWWRVEGATWLIVPVGILSGALATSEALAQSAGWGLSGLVVCLWAWARLVVETEAEAAKKG